MGINLGAPEQQGGESLDSAKIARVGDTFVGRIVDADFEVPVTDYDTGEVKVNKSGKPQLQYLLTCHVMGGTTAQVGKARVYRDAEIGETVSVWVAGLDKFNTENPLCFSKVLDQHVGGIGVGDVVKIVFAKEVPHENPRYNAKKIREHYLRHPKEDGSEAEAVAAAEAAYAARHAQTSLGAPAAPQKSLEDF